MLLPSPAVALSHLLGWTYTTAWSLSFWPQFILNYQRKSVSGLSIDFLSLNPLGFACYSVYNIALNASPTVRKEYRLRHDGHNPTIRLNDIAFALHALGTSFATLVQAAWFYRTTSGKVSTYNRTFITLSISLILFTTFLSFASDKLSPLDLLYLLSYIKLYISFAKYLPQAWLNYQRKSTVGWSIENILLDFTGGVLSFSQLILDAWISNDWTSITGNPGKLGLSFLSILFDLFFILQHFVLYRQNRSEDRLDSEEQAPLLDTSD